MQTADWTPGSLLSLSGSYWQAFTLHAGVKLDLFSQLGDETLSADELAKRLSADPRGTTMLLNALAAMQLLEKTADRYRASGAARQFLNRRSPAYVGHMIMHHHFLAEAWTQMDQAVISGCPVRTRAVDGDGDRREAFLMGMYTIASQQAPEIAKRIDLSDRRRLLDLGGGPGTYAIHFCQRYDSLEADVLDLPTTRVFAEKVIAQHGMSGRIQFIDLDFVQAPIPGRYDVAWLSHILHAESPDTCTMVLQKVARALEPGGMLIVHDFILDDSMDGPLFPALFALNMLQGTRAGQTYSGSQIRDMMAAAGIGRIQRPDYCGPTESSLLVGFKP